MPFWTVGDAGPYKEKSNFLMRSPLYAPLFLYTNQKSHSTQNGSFLC